MVTGDRARLLYSPCYAEPLKAMLPLINETKETYDTFVLNTISPSVSDQDKSEAILLSNHIPFVSVHEKADHPFEQLSRWVRLLHLADRRAGRVTKSIIADVVQRYAEESRWREISDYWLNKLQPSVLIVGGEHNPIQKHLIEECNRRGIPSITLQWGIANASVRHTLEMVERLKKRELSTLSRLVRRRRVLVSWLTSIVLKFTGLQVNFLSRIFGGGHGTIFAVIGQGCYENYVKMGIPADKMKVIGYPIYEELYRNAVNLRTDRQAKLSLYESLNIRHGRDVILWCTNDQRTYYLGFQSYERMLESWKSKLKILLALGDTYEIVVKLHPKEILTDYYLLGELSDRVHVIKDYDVRKIIPHCCLFITRFSSTAMDALCLGKPVITHNYPRIPGGTLYEDLGGTIHVMSDKEFSEAVTGILVNGKLLGLVKERREQFLVRYLDIRDMPAARRFLRLIDEVISDRAGHEPQPLSLQRDELFSRFYRVDD